MRQIYEGLGILLKYGEGYMAAEHDEIFAGNDGTHPDKMSKEDLDRLAELRWRYQGEDMGWHHFV